MLHQVGFEKLLLVALVFLSFLLLVHLLLTLLLPFRLWIFITHGRGGWTFRLDGKPGDGGTASRESEIPFQHRPFSN
ncbi:MAG: hypothetical protein ABI073_13150, partial [Luteolibacter sp.]